MTAVGTKLRFDCLNDIIPECPIIRECRSNATWSDVHTATTNVALNRFASQSTTYRNYHANNAVDGNINFRMGTCTHTKREENPWWRVDLDSFSWIAGAVIYNRKLFAWRLHDLDITVGATPDKMNHCVFFRGPGTEANLVLNLPCEQILYGRHVKLEIVHGYNNVLTLCEVQLF